MNSDPTKTKENNIDAAKTVGDSNKNKETEFIMKYDTFKCYDNYFPSGNIDVIIDFVDKFNSLRCRKKRTTIRLPNSKSYFSLKCSMERIEKKSAKAEKKEGLDWMQELKALKAEKMQKRESKFKKKKFKPLSKWVSFFIKFDKITKKIKEIIKQIIK